MATNLRPRSVGEVDDAAELVAAVHEILADHGHDLPVLLHDGRRLGPTHSTFRLHLRHPWSLRAMVVPPTDLTAGEAYLADDVDVQGSMIDALHAVARLRTSEAVGVLTMLGLATRVLRLPRPPRHEPLPRAVLSGRVHSRERDVDAVRFHYDVGNDFYARWLDRRMVYSCAYPEPSDDGRPDALDRAQERKLDLVCRKLRLRPGQRLLDVGCGWGALVLHAARHFGVHAVGLTLSTAQAELARRRAEEQGLADRVDIRVQDYRDLDDAGFDAIASVGMVEHVGSQMLAGYVGCLHRALTDGGRLLNHGITTGVRTGARDLSRASGSFVGTYVFPDGGLVPIDEIVGQIHRGGFEILDVEQLRRHYAWTLRWWVANLEAQEAAIVAHEGPTAYRVWRAYMSGSVVGFETGDLGVAQVLAVKGLERGPAQGRAWMLPQRP